MLGLSENGGKKWFPLAEIRLFWEIGFTGFPLAEKNLKFRFPLTGLENLFKNTFRLGGKTENPSPIAGVKD